MCIPYSLPRRIARRHEVATGARNQPEADVIVTPRGRRHFVADDTMCAGKLLSLLKKCLHRERQQQQQRQNGGQTGSVCCCGNRTGSSGSDVMTGSKTTAATSGSCSGGNNNETQHQCRHGDCTRLSPSDKTALYCCGKSGGDGTLLSSISPSHASSQQHRKKAHQHKKGGAKSVSSGASATKKTSSSKSSERSGGGASTIRLPTSAEILSCRPCSQQVPYERLLSSASKNGSAINDDGYGSIERFCPTCNQPRYIPGGGAAKYGDPIQHVSTRALLFFF